jgi:SAM-dependent methyltransferase
MNLFTKDGSKKAIGAVSGFFRSLAAQPKLTTKAIETLPYAIQGMQFAEEGTYSHESQPIDKDLPAPNPMAAYFESHKEGPGIWKWKHYFDVYHRHFSKFVGREVHVLEVGIYSGGSLPMWREYFGERTHIYGVDINEACRAYEDDRTKVYIGDQADRSFWARLKKAAPLIDIVIDDGGHHPEQQLVTLEEMLPHIRPGGVYLCEDIHGRFNGFAAYVHGLSDNLNEFHRRNVESPIYTMHSPPSAFQTAINSIHLYPFAAVIEKSVRPVNDFVCPKHGSQWQPDSFAKESEMKARSRSAG